jgi:enoyl reductase
MTRDWIRRLAITAVTLPLVSVALLAGALAGPAMAGGGVPPPVTPPPPSGGGQTGGGSNSGGTYTATVAEKIRLSGDANPGYDDTTWTPPECWLQPEFKQPQTYVAGDPSGGQTDANSYWWWFGRHYSGFNQFIHGTGSLQDIQQEFQQEQNMQVPAAWTGPNPITAADVWWAPNWLDGPAGWACAQGLIDTTNLSDGFIGMEPPAQPGAGGANGQISSQGLAGLARAALRLPTVKVVTSPPATSSATVNVPSYVSVVYGGNPQPADTATVEFADGTPYLSATVQASKPTVQISTNAPNGSYTATSDNNCAAAGDAATPACSITFRAPTGGTPYQINVTVSWTVTWTTSAGDGGTFPVATATGTSTLPVREIQTTN